MFLLAHSAKRGAGHVGGTSGAGQPGLFEQLQLYHQVIIAGPINLAALLTA
jgi:hypothetical protein